jgi:hypothetical protein
MVIVPNSLERAIYEKIDAEIAKVPEAAPGREEFYAQLLSYFYEHGVIPDFSLVKSETPDGV